MKSVLLVSVAVATIFMAHSQAMAQEADPYGNLGAYVSVFAGASFPGEISANFSSTSPVGGLLTSESTLKLKSGFVFGGAVGLQANDYVRGEIELSRGSWKGKSAHVVDSTGNEASGPLSGRASARLLLANVWLDGNNETAFTPYVGGGLGFGKVDTNLGDFLGDGDGINFAFQLGAGLKYALSDRVAIDMGYRYKSIPKFELKSSSGRGPNLTGAELESHNVQLGLTYGF